MMYSNKKVQEFPSVHGDIAIIHPVRRIDIIGNLGMRSGCLIYFLGFWKSDFGSISSLCDVQRL